MSGAASSPPTDLVSITVGTQSLSGWENIRVTRGIERVPADFSFVVTERYPSQAANIVIKPGDPCQIKLGADTVITGYVDRYAALISDGGHEITITGRSRLADMLDCSARFPSMSANNITMVALAKLLAGPLGISVMAPDGDSIVIPAFAVTLTETPYEILEQIARWAQFLLYDDADGNLVIAKLARTSMASGFAQGENIQSASISFSTDARYTAIIPVYLATTFLIDPPPAEGSNGPVVPFLGGAEVEGNFIPSAAATDVSFPARADGKPRYRPLIVVSPQTQNSTPLAAQYAAWEMARRVGRSQQLRVRCDSWRDSAGTLWTPNALAVLSIPALKIVNVTWLISEVTFNKDEQGTTADLVLMPKEAFAPQKEVLVPYQWQIDQPPNPGAGSNAGP